MFKINNEFKNANISRTVRFTEGLFEKMNETASDILPPTLRLEARASRSSTVACTVSAS